MSVCHIIILLGEPGAQFERLQVMIYKGKRNLNIQIRESDIRYFKPELTDEEVISILHELGTQIDNEYGFLAAEIESIITELEESSP